MFTQLPEGLRVARPDDYDLVAGLLDGWWGRPILDVLPRLFLDHFHDTSLVAPDPAGGAPRGLLVGFLSPARPDEAYIHLVGISPSARGRGLGRVLYGTFFEAARSAGRSRVCAVTSPVNTASLRFHRAMGFTVSEPVPDHNGPNRALVTFAREL